MATAEKEKPAEVEESALVARKGVRAAKAKRAATGQGKQTAVDDKAMGIDQEYELVDVDKVKPHPENPKKGALLEIENSIDANGWYGAIVVQKSTGYILAGNHRYRAALAHDAKQIPVIWKDVDDVTAKRIMLVDNRSADLGEYDEAKLKDVLGSLEELNGTGYDDYLEQFGLGGEGSEQGVDDDEAVPPDDATSTFGILVMCADEQEQEATFEKLTEQGYQVRVVSV